ncbi:uncharacterized protein N7515_001307 [Penicillium bovifimosum]|uniref:Uncharacterized protein n=1 Tax=Penicillium bovifimosum TaxID=126998 RepID=A0A9W9H9H6_9EURO|nr:uncharacterized protein N7515_001307 [Penicillium bovifimosum]KAJ5142520.1 hypothetical protein N7515_001307 [Penicillium bovifimosum]
MRSDCDPILPLYARSRKERARVPEPVEVDGKFYDVMGVSSGHELILRDQRAVHEDIRIEQFAGRPVMFDGVCCRVVSLHTTPDLQESTLQLINPRDPSSKVTVLNADIARLRFPGANGDHTLGRIKHGIVRMAPVVSRTKIKVPLKPNDRFEARLHNCELEGPYSIHVCDRGQLVASSIIHGAKQQRIVVQPDEIAPRYVTIMSLDFGANFDVDIFLYREDQLRGKANIIKAKLGGELILDPLLGSLPCHVAPVLTNGAEHLAVFEQFIRDRAQPVAEAHTYGVDCSRRRLTILNLSMCNQGDAHGVLNALIDFRRQNPGADMSIVISKLGPTEFLDSLEYFTFLKSLENHSIRINMFATSDGQKRQVIHGKAIVIDNQVLFSTGAVMDTRPINKADFSIGLPAAAATMFRHYTDRAIHGEANDELRARLASELASLGVIINDPVANLPWITRAQDALIRGARRKIILHISELVDPIMTQMLIDRAASGVDVTLQVREVDPKSALLLADARRCCSNLQVEDTSWWEPRPHFNVIIADGSFAYLGSSYIWPTQCHMVHQGRSFENGVLLSGDAIASLIQQLGDLRAHAHATDTIPSFAETLRTWKLQYSLKNPCSFPKYLICLEAWPTLTHQTHLERAH